MSFGWAGNILRVDLSKRESSREPTEPYTHSFIGGRGINAKVMFDEVGPEVQPFDPGNRVCFGVGVLTGTLSPSSSRMKVTSMSPNGLVTASGIGGFIAPEIKWAGYDNIVIQGKADKPVYLYIHNELVEFRDASHLWGKNTWEAQQIIKQELGDSVQTVCIGPAGEKLVSFGSIISGRTTAAGRGGMGAIMGSKNLKAIAVRGTRGVRIAKPKEFIEACKGTHRWLRENPAKASLAKGDTGTIEYFLDSGQFYFGNWEKDDINWSETEKYRGTGEQFWDKYALHTFECLGCPLAHSYLFNIPGIGIGSSDCVGWIAFGSQVWNSDRKVTFHANSLCDEYGLDCVSTGNIIAFLMQLYHEGIITEKDTDGIAMKRGDENAIIPTIHKIGKQEGFGKLFKNGVLEAARAIGKGAEEYAMHVKGLEIFFHEGRTYKQKALGWAIARDSPDAASLIDSSWPIYKEAMEKQTEELYGSKGAAVPYTYEKKALMMWDYENRLSAADILGVCKWVTPLMITPHYDRWVKLFSLATRRDTSEEELLTAAQRVRLLERAFSVIRGIRRKDDTLPERLFEVKVPGGIFKGEKLDKQKFDEMVDEYYELRSWDKDGVPTEEAFKTLGLSSEWKLFEKRLGKVRVAHG